MKKTSDKTEEQNEEYWNYYQTLAWIYLGDEKLIKRWGDIQQTTYLDTKGEAIGSALGSYVPPKKALANFKKNNKENNKEETKSSGCQTVIDITMWGCLNGAKYDSWEDANKELVNNIQDSKLPCEGLIANDNNLLEIPNIEWGKERWERLKFNKTDVISIWPKNRKIKDVEQRQKNVANERIKESIREFSNEEIWREELSSDKSTKLFSKKLPGGKGGN